VNAVIDTAKGVVPKAAVELAARVRLLELQDKAQGCDAAGILALGLEEFGRRIAMVSSFGAESAVLLHLVAQSDPTTPVLFLNTAKLFGETLRYRDRLQDMLGLTDLRNIGPHPADRERLDSEGTLWSRDTEACCGFRKVVPLRRALEGFDAQITGRKTFQTHARHNMQTVEYFEGRFRFNPLADWSQADIEAYLARYDLPRHPLVEDGYPSIGCIPCTRRVAAGESYRDGRWAGLDKDECGIHTGVHGDGI
jgi:phosphoadenosine phosphosulfate reductase